jgi:Protein of unknown function (DUF3072)
LEARLFVRTIHERRGTEQRDDKQDAERRQTDGEVNPKINSTPNSNTEKEPDDRVSGDDPMTGAPAPYLRALSEEVGEPDNFKPELTKAAASKRIDALNSKRTSAGQR